MISKNSALKMDCINHELKWGGIMGLFSRSRSSNGSAAVMAVQKIMNGSIAKISLSQVVMLITNLQDAKKNLSSEEFEKVMAMYEAVREETLLMEMDEHTYLESATYLISEFEKIAPYMLFDGNISEDLELKEQLKIRSLYLRGVPYEDALMEYKWHNSDIRIEEDCNIGETTSGKQLGKLLFTYSSRCSVGIEKLSIRAAGYLLAIFETVFMYHCLYCKLDEDYMSGLQNSYIISLMVRFARFGWNDSKIDELMRLKSQASVALTKQLLAKNENMYDSIVSLSGTANTTLQKEGISLDNVQQTILEFYREMLVSMKD